MKKIKFEDGQLVTAGYVEINNIQHEIHEAEYESATPLSAHVLNTMQNNIEHELCTTKVKKGEEVTITDSANVRAKLDISGKTVQNGEASPNNVCEIRNVGDNINIFDEELEIGAISTTTGELTTNAQRQRSKNFIKVKNNTNYIMTVNNELISLNRMFYDKDYNFISTTTLASFKTPINSKYMKFYGTSDLAGAKIKIQESTIVTSYVPYNCGSIDLKIVNDNLYDVNAKDKTISNTTIDENGWITIINDNTDGTTVKNAQLYKSPSIDIKVSTDYYLVTEIKEFTGEVNVFTVTGATTSSNKSQFKTECKLDWNNLSNGQIIINKITTRDDFSDCVVFLRTLLQTKAGQSASITFRMSLFENEITKDTFLYKEYKNHIISFPLSEGQVLHENDYLAEDGIHQRRKTYIFTGKESFKYSSSNNVIYTDILTDKKLGKDNFLLSHYKVVNERSYPNMKINTATGDSSIANRIIFKTEYVTANGLKEYLAKQYTNSTPVIAEYECENETILPYNEEQKETYYQLQHLLMQEEYNRIFCLNEIKSDMQLTYYYDNETNNIYAKRIDYLEEKIRQLEQKITI